MTESDHTEHQPYRKEIIDAADSFYFSNLHDVERELLSKLDGQDAVNAENALRSIARKLYFEGYIQGQVASSLEPDGQIKTIGWRIKDDNKGENDE